MITHLAAVTLRWLGQACFIITSMHGNPILVDPPHPEVGYAIAAHSIACSAVFVSHEHFDHNFTDAAIGNPTIVQPMSEPGPDIRGSLPSPGDLPADIQFTRIFAYHDNVQGALRGPDTITILNIDGLRIIHMGDIGELTLSPAQLASIGHADILMIPVGGYYTVDAREAAALIAEIKPRIVIPMHYQTPALNPDLRSKLHPVSEFLRVMAPIADEIDVTKRDLMIDPKHLPNKLTIYVIRYE
jgi:L-ascorbate metabolism protein UlaG (beta-lactamase superfamily)